MATEVIPPLLPIVDAGPPRLRHRPGL